MKKLRVVINLLKNTKYSTKIKLYFSSRVFGDDYDEFENNYQDSLLNPITIKAFVREFSPESAYWRQYGVYQTGLREILTEEKYRNYFEKASKIEIDGIKYETFKEGGKTTITSRPYKMLRIIVVRAG